MKIWRNVMERIHEGYEYKEFEMPNSIEKKTICTKTGKLASSGACSSYTEYFAPGTAPTQSCPGHVVEKPAHEATSEESEGENNSTDPNSGNTSDSPAHNNGNSDGESEEGGNSDGSHETPPIPPTP